MDINNLISTTKKKIAGYYLAETILKLAIAGLLLLFINYFADILDISNVYFRISIWCLLLGFLIFLILKIITKLIFLQTADEYIALLIQKKNSKLNDDLINAVQLERNNYSETSAELAKEFVKITSSKISLQLSNTVINFSSLKSIFIVFVVLFVNFILFYNSFQIKRYFLPFSSSIKVSVLPGDISVNTSDSINIYTTVKPESIIPFLFFREYNSEWRNKKMKRCVLGKYTETIDKITADTEYYVQAQDIRSPKYKIKITSPLVIADIKLEYIYPPYTGLSNKITDEGVEPDIGAPVGTTIKVTAKSNKKIKTAFLLTDTNEKIPMHISKNLLTSQFIIQNQSAYWIEATADNGETNSPIRHIIKIIKNIPPTVEILAPACNVMVSENDSLKIIYTAEDDFGISEINMNLLTLQKRTCIKSFPKPQQKVLDDYEISIAELNLKPGDVVQYRVEATDNNIYPSPETGISKIWTFEVLSYQMEHKIIEAELSEFNIALQEILSRQLQSRTALTTSPPDYETAIGMQKNTQELTNKTLANLSAILKKMANDPLTSYFVYTEYENLAQSLSTLEKDKMNSALTSLTENKFATAEQHQNEIIDELQRLVKFSQDIIKNQKMEDIVSTVAEMNDFSSDIQANLKQLREQPSKEKMRQLQKAMEKLSDLMTQLAEKVASIPSEMPQDFANNENVKKINLTEMRLTADEMKWTLQAGNIDKAIELAQKLSQQISDILNAVENSAKSVSDNRYKELEAKLNESMHNLTEIIETQKSILSDTQQLDSKRLEKILQLQKELLKKLAEKQKQAIAELQTSKTILEKSTTTQPSIFNLYIQPETQMNIVLKEFSDEKIEKSKKLLSEIIAELEYLTKNVTLQEAQQHISISKVIEQEILDELTNFSPPKTDVFNNADLDKHNQLAEKQQTNQLKTQALQNKLSVLSYQTLSIPRESIKNISDSEKSMGIAANELSNFNTTSAVDSEKKALDDLLNSKDSLEKASNQMKQLAIGTTPMGMGSSGMVRVSGNGTGGYTGFRTGYVKIPSLDDYKPPKEFRETIIESLRQKYPQKYEPIIKDYFKRLIE
ncbi:MAG: DUF4175 family protein [Elusimicrobiota bacterium]